MFKQCLLSVVAILLLTVGAVTAQEKYAVLITGDYAAKNIPIEKQWDAGKSNPMEEFWHDTFLMWEMLLAKGYSAENIIVLFADGTDFYLDADWVAPRYKPNLQDHGTDYVTDYSATRANVDMVFAGLANGSNGFPEIKQEDFLFVWTFDRNYNENKNYIYLFNNEKISNEDFDALTNQINCNKKVKFK